ncbi:hypothetical protein VP01_4639g1, partial [Puccinia sorghi]
LVFSWHIGARFLQPSPRSRSALLKQKPRFTVLLGPPSSRKMALAQHVTSKTQPDDTPEFHPLTIDLRAVNKNGSFLKAFMHQGILVGSRDGFWKDILGPLTTTIDPGWVTRTVPCSLLVQIQAFSDDNIASREIDVFLNFAVRITKQEAKMHVIFTSSDSFFESWLKQRVNPTHFCTLVVGDLPCLEAHNYFLHMVENNQQLSKEKKDILSSINFDIPFKMTGGRMFFLEQYIEDVCGSGYFDDHMNSEFYLNLRGMESLFLSFHFSHPIFERIEMRRGDQRQVKFQHLAQMGKDSNSMSQKILKIGKPYT